MADPEVQAFAAEQFALIHEAIYDVLGDHPESASVANLKSRLDAFYLGAVSILDIQTVAARDGGHKPPPEPITEP